MPEKVEISPHNSCLIYKKGYTPEFIFETIQKRNLNGLKISAVLEGDRVDNVEFLKECTFLQALYIVSANDLDFGFLKTLHQLKELSITCEGKNKIDLSSQINLEILTLNWRKGTIGIGCCKHLKTLVLWEYKESDLSSFQMLFNLEKLAVKTSSIKDLNGLEALESLVQIQLGNCRSLRSIKALNGLKKLAIIDLEYCPKIEDYTILTDLPSLESLRIIDCKGIPSLKFIQNFRFLKTLDFSGNTDILDGDLIPARAIPHVNYIARKHYNIKIESPEEDANMKRNIEMIKKSRR